MAGSEKQGEQSEDSTETLVPALQVHDVEVIEHDKTGHVQRRWLHAANNKVTPIFEPGKSDGFFSRSAREWRKLLSDAFLPVGFPHSVSADYLSYQTYDSLQAFFSTITSLLANRALLQGLGVGDADSSATFAMLLTILKDAMSRVATIVFAHRFGLRIEPDAKRYRLLADVFNDTAFFLELWSPYLGPWGKVGALSLGEALRALCGVAAGASKAALSVHFAKHDNLAELNAKEASQETAVGLVGLLVGTFVVKCVEDHRKVVYLTIVLVLAHLLMNYLGVRSVIMNSFNRQRAGIVATAYLDTGEILSPTEVAEREFILLPDPVIHLPSGLRTVRIEFAQSYGHAMSRQSTGRFNVIKSGDVDTKFISVNAFGDGLDVKMLLGEKARPFDAVKAWFEAIRLARELENDLDDAEAVVKTINAMSKKNGKSGAVGQRVCNKKFWKKVSEQGWDLDTQLLETCAPVRLSFVQKDKDE